MAYSRVTNKRYRYPYQAIIEAGMPAARQSKYLSDQATLTREQMAQNDRVAADDLAMRREMASAQKKQANTAAILSGVQTAGMLGYAGHKVWKGEVPSGGGSTPPTPTGAPAPVNTSGGMVMMGPGTNINSPVSPMAPSGPSVPIKTGGGTVMGGPGTALSTPVNTSPAVVSNVPASTVPASSVSSGFATGVPAANAAPETTAALSDYYGASEVIEGGGGSATASGGGASLASGKVDMSAGTKVGYGVAGAQQAHSLYKGLDRSSDSYEDGSKGKYGSALGRVGGSVVGAYFGGPLGLSIGGEVGSYVGEKTWPGVVRSLEAGDEIIEDLASLKVHSAGERINEDVVGNIVEPILGRGAAEAVGKPIEEVSRVIEQIFSFSFGW